MSRCVDDGRGRAIGVLLVVVLGLSWLTGAHPVGAVPSEGALADAEARAKELAGLVADAERELAGLRSSLADLEVRLDDAQDVLSASTATYVEADRAAIAAGDRAKAAQGALDRALADQSSNQETLTGLARDTYKHGAGASSPMIAVLGSSRGDDGQGHLADRLHFLQRSLAVRTVALERSDALAVEVDHLHRRARDEQAAAEVALAAADDALEVAAEAHALVADLTAETSDKLERSAQLVAALEGERTEVATRVVRLREQVQREREEKERREREERERREREARERAAREREARERAAREQAQRTQPRGGGGPASVRPGPNQGLVTVGGITVAASLGPQLAALLDHARADGIVLGGHGWRSPEVTARLRMANGCPDVHRSPASACRVPTARPGTSQHERGLAIDFTYRGRTICYPRSASRCAGNPAFEWLRRNAGAYGLRNLPSEAWHWSTTGR